MEVPSNEFAEGGGGLPPNMFAGKSADKIVRKVSKQLARPNVAGFQSRLDRDDFSALLKNVSAEKIDVLLDEFMVEVRDRVLFGCLDRHHSNVNMHFFPSCHHSPVGYRWISVAVSCPSECRHRHLPCECQT